MNLGSLLEGLLNNQGNARGQSPLGTGSPGQGGGQGGFGNLPGNFGDLSSRIPGGMGGLAGGALLSLILGSKTGRSAGGSLLKAGGLAVLSAVAMKAYQDWQNRQAPGTSTGPENLPQQIPSGSGFHIGEEKDSSGREFGVALIQAMISAAKSDGHLDGQESARIQEQIQKLGLGAEEKGFLMDVMGKPADAAAVARLAGTQAQASELYVASLLAIGDADTPEEKAYLQQLTAQMQLPPDLVAHLDAQVSALRLGSAQGVA
ncbi:tellurite resistance TerB family protein [Microvirga rosea]|uniref:tellurite resistance TerB family protein n=1 Tax=Microvirga rosea TaxID=2715425 RepID=UPI001D0A1C09|nr:tellurite resistance TerB family protein [Microvirga rosea]MCB8819869.1 tellurite resistance TerB family protein [Microvirga rosea]